MSLKEATKRAFWASRG